MGGDIFRKMKLGKYDKVCKYCKKVIKGATRETIGKGDTMGTICSDDKENYWHLKCEK